MDSSEWLAKMLETPNLDITKVIDALNDRIPSEPTPAIKNNFVQINHDSGTTVIDKTVISYVSVTPVPPVEDKITGKQNFLSIFKIHLKDSTDFDFVIEDENVERKNGASVLNSLTH